MPELPEVETIRRQLKEVLVGKRIAKIEVLKQKSFDGKPEKLVGWEVSDILRKSKVIEVLFKGKTEMMIVHLKMTGQLIYTEKTQKTRLDSKARQVKNSKTQNEESVLEKRVVGGHPTADWVNSLPSKHTRVIIDFDDGSKLFFNDMRVFGWMKVLEKDRYEKEVKKLVPDVVDPEFTLSFLAEVLSKTGKPIKLVLLDQDKIGGLGNIYVNDALNLARILPMRRANELSESERKKLYESINSVIDLGIKSGGASAANYVDTKGLGGTYQNYFLTYKRDGLPCKNCGEKIVKIKLGGRGTFYCPNCQK